MPDGRKVFIFGRRSSGSFDVRTLDGEKISAGMSFKKLSLLSGRTAILYRFAVKCTDFDA
ncbi:MAG: hypothetical protein LBU32_27790 [Clostridiales bacterium]|jgi:N6-L-threonylcarbamoyladenine synthase|nr:hypothetical protein [Clostridiales bacterium]